MRHSLDAIIFDFDGVLVESVDIKGEAFASLYAEYGPDIVARVLEHHRSHGGVSRFEKFRYYHEVFLGRRLSADGESLLAQRFSQLVEDAVVEAAWVRGAKEFLEKFVDRVPMFVASGTPDAELKEIVRRRRMTEYFVSVHGSPDRKPEIIRRIIKRNGFDSGRIMVVGDASTDFDAALEVGTQFVGRADGNSPFPAGVKVIPDLTDLAGAAGLSIRPR